MSKKYRIALMTGAAHLAAFMSDIVETVTVETDNGPVRINKSAYDPDKHKLVDAQLRFDGPTVDEYVKAGYDPANYPPAGYVSRSSIEEIAAAVEAHKKPKEPAQQPQQPVPGDQQQTVTQRLVSQFGSKWFIVDEKGEKLTGEGIDGKGYKSEADAWAAVMSLPAVAPVA